MGMRVSHNMMFGGIVDSIFRVQNRYDTLLEKVTTGREINRPSENPTSYTRIKNFERTLGSVEMYSKNIDDCRSWLNMTESALSGVGDILVNAREVAVSQSSGTASKDTRLSMASSVEQMMEEICSLGNTKLGDRYIFSGTDTESAPFASEGSAANIADPGAGGNNAFDGTVVSGGTYTGSVNGTYAVKIISGGALADATYKISSDGGKTWGAEQTDLDGGTVTVGDGITLTFTDDGSEHLAGDDLFFVRAYTDGYYRGNGEELYVDIGKDIQFTYSLSGESVFTDRGDGIGARVDILDTLTSLKEALEADDSEAIAAVLDDLETASDQINSNISICGTRVNRLDIAENNLNNLEGKMTEILAKESDVDLTEVITELSMQEVVLQASYSISSSIGNLTILNFLK